MPPSPDNDKRADAKHRIQSAAQAKASGLDLSDLGLTRLPESIGQLTQLEKLNIGANRLTALPDWLGHLRRLQRLDVFDNQLTSLPESLSQLPQLQELNLGMNRLTALPECLGGWKHLQVLRVSDNRLKSLPECLGQLRQLRFLAFPKNCVTTLPACLGQLAGLRGLSAWGNQLTTLPEALGQLSRLQDLDVSRNQLLALPEGLSKLTQLQRLNVASNRLTGLPACLSHLTQLRRINAADNQLTSLPEGLKRLTLLNELYLHGNDALGLPPELLGPTWQDVVISHNLGAAPAAILDYYFRARRGQQPLNEAKLILVGRGGVGKTCLLKRLLRDTFDEHEPETPGIEIQTWPVGLPDGDQVRLHVWDFGGQEILHATHQFFLTERSLYLLVLSGREGNPTQDAEYWLQLIRSFGGNSRVVIALNKSTQHPFDLNRGLLLEKYPCIAGFVKTDCADPAPGIPELHATILRETAALEHRKADFPADWFAIKERLAKMSENNENLVTWEEYQEICRGLGENDPQAQRHLARFLHVLGIALNYADDPRLRDTHVLNPRWVTEGIYTLLRAGQKQKCNGVLAQSDVAAVLTPHDYPATSHDFLLRLMEKYQLCFELGHGRYLVPELLGENQPDEIRSILNAPGLVFRYQYEVLPEGLLPRFIVQTHAHSERQPHLRWRTGVVLERDGCQAVVRADARERRVDIHITGPERPRRDLLAIMRDKFDEQHRDLKGLTVDERVPIPGEGDASGKGLTVSYRHLLTLEEEDEKWCRPEGSKQKHRVADLLNGVESQESRQQRRERDQKDPYPRETIMPKKHVFLSYCHNNEAEVAHLRADLLAAGEAVWWDKDILGGKDWKQEIRRAMKHSYAVVLCLSQKLAARSESGVYPEVADAISLYRTQAPGSVFLVPVRLSDCEIPDIELDDTRTLDRLQCVDLFPAAKRVAGFQMLLEALRACPSRP